jgi:four helix bundle protein
MGEAMETQSWLDDALDSNYISAEQHQEYDAAWQGIGGMLNCMIERADDFCSQHER